MSRNDGERREGLSADIRRQLGTQATMHFLRTLPAFHTEPDIPDRLRELLDRLDAMETGIGRRRTTLVDLRANTARCGSIRQDH